MSVTFIVVLMAALGGTGNPSPEAQVQWAYDTGGKIYASPVPVDLEGDGSIEIIVAASRARRLLCLDGRGELRWEYQVVDGDADGFQATPSAVDLDGDGRKEVLFLTRGGMAGCVDASGRLRWRTFIDDTLDYTGPAVADITGNGRTEILFGSDSGTLYCLDDTGRRLWHYQGPGQIRGVPAIGRAERGNTLLVYAAFGGGMMACFDCEGRLVWHRNDPGPRGERRTSPSIGDLNGDGRPEVVCATEDFQVVAYDAWTGDERWRWKGQGNIDQASSFALADFDGAGRLDVVCGDSSGHVYRLRDGAAVWTANVGGGVVQGPALGDVDGDGALDILVSSRSNRLVCLSEDGVEKWSFSMESAPLTTPALGDFDGDGVIDVVFTSKDGFVRSLRGGGAAGARLPWPMSGRSPRLTGNVGEDTLTPTLSLGEREEVALTPTLSHREREEETLTPTLSLGEREEMRVGENEVVLSFANTEARRRRLEAVAEITRPDRSLVTRRVVLVCEPHERRSESVPFEALDAGKYEVLLRLLDAGTGESLASSRFSVTLDPVAAESAELMLLHDGIMRRQAFLQDRDNEALKPFSLSYLAFPNGPLAAAKRLTDRRERLRAVEEIRADLVTLRGILSRLVAAERSAVPPGTVAVVADTTLRKVFRDEPYLAPDALEYPFHVELARNEYEGIQVVIVPRYEGTRSVSITCDGLLHDDGSAAIPGKRVEIRPVGYVEIGQPEYNWRVEKVGAYPDILLPNEPVPVPGTQDAQPFFVTVRTTAETAPGRYTGALRVLVDGEPAGEAPLTAEVWDFALPDTPTLKTSFWMNEGHIARFYNYAGRAPFEVRKRFYDLHLEYRVSPLKDFPMARDEQLEDFEYVMTHGQNCYFLPVPDAAGPARDAFAERVRAATGYLEGKGWSDMGAYYTMDEVAVMQRHRFADFVEMSAWLEATFPEWPRLQTSAPEQALFGAVDVWCPTIDHFDPAILEQRMAAGDRLWFYTVWGRPGIMIEFPATDHRLMFWQCWKYGAEGFLYWGTTHWSLNLDGEDRWPVRPWITYNEQPGHNGCGYLLYPGPEGTPLASTRLHVVRDGIEDFEYLHQLRRLCEAADGASAGLPAELRARIVAALAIPDRVLVDHKSYTEDPTAILDARREVANLIEVLGQLHES
ncbi:MAG TPA: FG-GAP-like repeat-containing protein [Candidatus Hydrogenedentes bacterium]|nr:FG-GAP-like repeat-containing protein [Candidatus Hydrogenedentota bacterium]